MDARWEFRLRVWRQKFPVGSKELRIFDNQFVHKRAILYVIDKFDFENGIAREQGSPT
jgi:hypothetical protein